MKLLTLLLYSCGFDMHVGEIFACVARDLRGSIMESPRVTLSMGHIRHNMIESGFKCCNILKVIW